MWWETEARAVEGVVGRRTSSFAAVILSVFVGCGGNVSFEPVDGSGGAGAVPGEDGAAVGTGASSVTTGGGGSSQGGASNGGAGGLLVGGGVRTANEMLCAEVCMSAELCLVAGTGTDCYDTCTQNGVLCEEEHAAYLECVLASYASRCDYEPVCAGAFLQYAAACANSIEGQGCGIGGDGSCFCTTTTVQGLVVESSCSEGVCNCAFDDGFGPEILGACTNASSVACGPFEDCCTSLLPAARMPLPIP